MQALRIDKLAAREVMNRLQFLGGHLHLTVQERFSPTAMQYVIGGNFLFHGQEVLFT